MFTKSKTRAKDVSMGGKASIQKRATMHASEIAKLRVIARRAGITRVKLSVERTAFVVSNPGFYIKRVNPKKKRGRQ